MKPTTANNFFVPERRAFSSRQLMIISAIALSASIAASHPELEAQIAEQTKLIQADPHNAKLYLRRGELHRLHQEWALALADYDRAQAADPLLGDVQFCRGRALVEAGRGAEALPILEQYLISHQEVAEAHASYGRALLHVGRREEAAGAFSKSLARRFPPRPEDYAELANTLASLPTADGATRALEQLNAGIGRLGSVPVLEQSALDLEIQLKRWDDALARLERLAAASARPEGWLVRKGDLLTSLTRTAAARENYQAAVKAIATLPDSRRFTEATQAIESNARRGLAQLEGTVQNDGATSASEKLSPAE